MEAATLVSANYQLDYESALTYVSKKFVEEDLKGLSEGLKPLVDRVTEKKNCLQTAIVMLQDNARVTGLPKGKEKLPVQNHVESIELRSNKTTMQAIVKQTTFNIPLEDDGIDWDIELLKANGNEMYQRIVGGLLKKTKTKMGSNMAGNLFDNCNVDGHDNKFCASWRRG
ncbi:unnamed protein product [Calypogeia fissa]